MKTDGRVVRHKVSSYEATDAPDTKMPSVKLPKFVLEPESRKSKLII